MRIIFLIICIALTGCSKVESVAPENGKAGLQQIPAPLPTVGATKLLKAVTPKVRLNSKQKRNLDESIPPQVREILEKSEKFEILAEVNNEPDSLCFDPNRIAEITDENTKKEILETFYYDASGGNFPSACYIPHHSIRATYQKKTVEIEICFQCSLFVVKSPFGKFEGGMASGNQKSEELFNQIIQNRSVEIK